MDWLEEDAYRRVVLLDGQAVTVRVTQTGPPAAPRLLVEAAGTPPTATPALRRWLERVLGLRVDLAPFYRLAASDRRLGPLAHRFRGLRPPQFPSVFEAVVNAIACQQVSLALGLTLLNRLALAFGRRPARGGGWAFPAPEDLARVPPAALHRLGFSRAKAEAIVELARAVRAGRDLEGLRRLSDAAAMGRLLALRGIGRWSAEYVLLRGLGRLHVFPADDLGAQASLQRWFGLPHRPDRDEVQRLLAPWQPYAGLVYFHLLLDGLARRGLVLGAGADDGGEAPGAGGAGREERRGAAGGGPG